MNNKDDDNPEWTEAEFTKAKPASEVVGDALTREQRDLAVKVAVANASHADDLKAECDKLKCALTHILTVCPSDTGGLSSAALAGTLFNIEQTAKLAVYGDNDIERVAREYSNASHQ